MDYSVLMSVYYKEKPEYLYEAMDSIWKQTIPTDDFVLVCDGPLTKELDRIICEMQIRHPELNVIRLTKNRGLGIALNEGIKYCTNELIARMDSDDISMDYRCEKQLKCFIDNPELSICSGTVVEFVGNVQNVTGKRELPESDEAIRVFSKKRNPFNHPAVMFRKSAVIDAGGYNESYHLFEDYYLWIRMLMSGAKGCNISEGILFMRTTQDLYFRRGGKEYAKEMIAFHKWMKKTGWSSNIDYLTGAIPHAIICVLPNTVRKKVYECLHYSNS